MMNLSELLTAVKMDLGIYGLSLPFENPDKVLFEVIKLKSLKTFSIFQPQIMKIKLDANELRCLKADFAESIYELPDVFGDKHVLYIQNIYPNSNYVGSGYITPGLTGSIEDYQNMMLGQAASNLTSILAPSMTFKFKHPNQMIIYNLAALYGKLDVELAIEHADNLRTIRPTAWQSFYDLVLLDIQIFLFNTLKHYNEIQTAYGTIMLRIDDWSGAKNDREALVEKWRDAAHLDVESLFIM